MDRFANLTPEGVELVRQAERRLCELMSEPVLLLAYRAEKTEGE